MILLHFYLGIYTDADLNEEEIFDSLTLLSWYLHRFWKSLVRHVFPAAKLIAETYPRIITKIPETLHYIYDPNCFQQNFVDITEIPSETIQKLSINHQHIEIKNYKDATRTFTSTNITEKTNTSLEVSPIENMETIIHSQPLESRINETKETDFNSTHLDDGTLFSSHTVNTLIDLEDNDQNNNSTANTTENTNIYQNHQHRQPVNSTELTQNSNSLNRTIPPLTNVSTPLPRLHRQNSVHFNTEPIILNNSTQTKQGTNQSIQITPQQLVNIV